MNKFLKIASVLVVLTLSACTLSTPNQDSERSAIPTQARVAANPHTPTPADALGHTMPWPKTIWSGFDSPDREITQSDAKPEGFTSPPPGQGVSRYLNQELDWQACDDFECATMIVPLDWENPDGEAITIAMTKRVGQGDEGTLFINPGGPGGSAQDYVDYFQADQLSGYDIIGMDPRGSGESTPVVCGDQEMIDKYLATDISPDDQSEVEQLNAAVKEFTQSCRANSGELLDHISSIETVYDFELARQLVGDDKFNFYGVSYGTYLGALYLELYPQNAGRIVLDSAVLVEPSDDITQAQGFDLSLENYAQWCASSDSCSLGDTKEEVVAKFNDFFNQLDQHPLQTNSGRELTQALGVTGVLFFFYSGADAYQDLTDIMVYTLKTAKGDALLMMADTYNGRSDDGYDNMVAAFPAIACADEPDDGVDAAYSDWVEAEKLAPIFGYQLGPNLTCPFWSAKSAPMVKFSGSGAPPVLVLGNTGDSATPYQQSVLMADTLESAILLTRDGPGHGVLNESACIDEKVYSYFNNGSLPEGATKC